jgi:hypothetical protein
MRKEVASFPNDDILSDDLNAKHYATSKYGSRDKDRRIKELGYKPKTNKKKKKRPRDKKFECHGNFFQEVGDDCKRGVEGLTNIGDFCKYLHDNLKDLSFDKTPAADNGLMSLLCRAEDLTALVAGVLNSANFVGMISVIHLYVRSLVGNKSVAYEIAKTFTNIISNGDVMATLRNGVWSVQSAKEGSETTIFDTIRTSIRNWSDCVKTSPLAQNITNALSFMVTVGFFPEAASKHKEILKSFQVRSWNVQKHSVDFMMMIIDTVIFFCERFYLAFMHNDISFLWMQNEEAESLDQEFATLVTLEPCVDLGQQEIFEKHGINGIEEYHVRIEKLVKRFEDALRTESRKIGKASDNPMLRQSLLAKLTKAKQLYISVLTRVQGANVRIAPYAITLFGPSSVGKTHVTNLLMRCVLAAGNYPNDSKNIATFNEEDAYDSAATNETYGGILDDFCASKAQYMKRSPVGRIISMKNNAAAATVQADVALKNKIFWNSLRCLIVNTNKKTQMAEVFSNCPEAVLRRYNLFITVTLNPDFVDPETGGPDGEKMSKAKCPNAWLFTGERVKLIRNPIENGELKDSYEFVTLFENKPITYLLTYCNRDARNYFAVQKQFVKNMECFDSITLCEHGMPEEDCPLCFETQEHTYEEHVAFRERTGHDCAYGQTDHHRTVGINGGCWGGECALFKDGWGTQMDWVPYGLGEQFAFDASYLDGAATFGELHNLHNIDIGFKATAAEICAESKGKLSAWYKNMCQSRLVSFLDEHRSALMAGAIGIAGIVGAMYLFKNLSKTYNAMNLVTQQNNDDTPPIQKEDGDGTAVPTMKTTDKNGVWKKFNPPHIVKTSANKTTTVKDMCDKVSKLQSFVSVEYVGEVAKAKSFSNIFPLKSNIWLVNSHMLSSNDPMIFTVRQHSVDEVGNGRNFVCNVDDSCFERIKGTDFAVVRLQSGGDVPNMLKHFMENESINMTAPLYAHTFYRDDKGVVTQHHVTYAKNVDIDFVGDTADGSQRVQYPGLMYDYKEPTKRGLCMMTHVLDQRVPTLGMFHCAGKTGETCSIAGIVSQHQIEEAITALTMKGMVMHSHSSGEFMPDKYGYTYELNVHPRDSHCVNFMTADEEGREPSFEYMGCHTTDTGRFKSNIKKTKISDDVEDIMGIPKVHGPPSKKHIWKHYQRDMALISQPRTDFSPKVLDLCVKDYLDKLKEHLAANPGWLDDVKPLPWEYCINGYDGIAAYNAIDKTTSMGPPINKPKRDFLGPIKEVYPGISEAFDFYDPQFRAEVDRMEEVLKSGERVNTHFRACLKDEAVKYGKDKIRVFNSGEVAYLLLCRKYLLPIIRLIHDDPTVFEMALGVNSHSKEWGKLREYLAQFDLDRIFAGDYKAFDKIVSAELSGRSAYILEVLCRLAGYSDWQVVVVRGLTTEVVYPVYDFVGLFFKALGSNPSGHPLTTIINGLNNSLYVRYAFYMRKIKNGWKVTEIPLFHTRSKLLTFGDDNIGSVSRKEKEFDHTVISEELGKCGVTYTMADKISESVPFVPLDKAEFLKRGWYWNEDLQDYTANLSIESIAKSLHNFMYNKKSDVSEDEICANALRAAHIEFFYHGREVFDLRSAQIEQLIEKHELRDYIGMLPTYQEYCDKFNGIDSANKIAIDLDGVMLQ